MLTLSKMTQIITEHDPDKQAEMLAALSPEDRAALEKEAASLRETGRGLADRSKP